MKAISIASEFKIEKTKYRLDRRSGRVVLFERRHPGAFGATWLVSVVEIWNGAEHLPPRHTWRRRAWIFPKFATALARYQKLDLRLNGKRLMANPVEGWGPGEQPVTGKPPEPPPNSDWSPGQEATP